MGVESHSELILKDSANNACWKTSTAQRTRVLHIDLAPVSCHPLKSDNKELSNTLLPHLCFAGYMPEHCQRTVAIPVPLLHVCLAFYTSNAKISILHFQK